MTAETNDGRMSMPTVHPGKSRAHRLVTKAAISRFGVAFIRRIGRKIDPILARLTGGRLSSVYPFPVVLLTHTGARSGVRRTSAIVYFTDQDRVILIASSFGSPRNPAWYYNITANPEVILYGRGIRGRFKAAEVNGGERERLFNRAKSADSPYREYERSAGGRHIPLIALYPISDTDT